MFFVGSDLVFQEIKIILFMLKPGLSTLLIVNSHVTAYIAPRNAVYLCI